MIQPRKAFQFTPLREGRQANHALPLDAVLFQFTPLREGRQDAPEQDELEYYFNSRPSARGDTACRRPQPRSKFQFTPLREGRPLPSCGWRVTLRTYFNSRPSARGDRSCASSSSAHMHFNSRPSARGDPSDLPKFTLRTISIHAPPRGATRFPRGAMWRFGSFQFTPLREGRRCLTLSIAPALAFQFTPLREGRQG